MGFVPSRVYFSCIIMEKNMAFTVVGLVNTINTLLV